MFTFPPPVNICEVLLERLKELRWTKKEVHDRYQKACAAAKVKADHYNVFNRKLVRSSPATFGKFRIEEFGPLLEAFNYSDVDLFLDACYPATIRDVVFIKSGQWEVTGGRENKSSSARASDLLNNRTRLDILILEAQQDTGWKQHGGHEFVRVVRGVVHCSVSDSEKCPSSSTPVVTHVLAGVVKAEESAAAEVAEKKLLDGWEEGPAVVFPSKIWHRFWNEGTDPVQLAVARPTHSTKNT